MYVFATKQYNTNNAQVPFRGRIYSLEIMEGGIKKIHLVPCIKLSNNSVGFYNIPNKTFYDNANWTAGPDI